MIEICEVKILFFILSTLLLTTFRSWHRPNDFRISRIGDRKGAHSEVLSAGSTKLIVVASVVVDTSFGQHSVVLNLRFPVNKIETLPEPEFATAKSLSPSPLKSAISEAFGE